MLVPPLETDRLIVRPFAPGDLEDIHRILDVELAGADLGESGSKEPDERRRWLQWTIMSYEQFARLHQPPYGDRAIVLKETGQIVGACGFVPCLNAFDQLPSFGASPSRTPPGRTSTELGLFYALSPAHQRRGYATEASRALIDYAFTHLRLKRIVATTTRDNMASMAVMRRVGMQIVENPYANPPWLQIVGLLDHMERS